MMEENLNEALPKEELRKKEKNEKSYSGRKTFAFSDESQYQLVEELLQQKPQELTNADVLVKALTLFVESEEIHQSLNHLPQTAAEIFKGDLAKLDVAFETIRSVFSAQMKSSTELILQREDKLQRKYETLLTQKETQLEVSNKQIELLAKENETLKSSVEIFKAKETEWEQTKGTLNTLQQALQSEQQRVQQLEAIRSAQNEDQFLKSEQLIKELQQQVQELTVKNRELSIHNEHLLTEKTTLQTDLREKQESLKQLEMERQQLQDKMILSNQQSQERFDQLMNQLIAFKNEKK